MRNTPDTVSGRADRDLNLAGKVAVVTGASRGIGRAVARRLAAEGMAVAVTARDGGRLSDLAAEVETAGGRMLVFPADLADLAAPAAFAAAAVGRFGRIDLVVNNAGHTDNVSQKALTPSSSSAS